MFRNSILLSLFLFFLYTNASNAQTVTNKAVRYSEQTKKLIKKLDSLYKTDAQKHLTLCVESEYIGEALLPSEKFKLYSQLLTTSTKPELIALMNDKSRLAPIRGYAYMAYRYQCDQKMAMSHGFNCNFKINVLIGTLQKTLSSSDFAAAAMRKEFYNAGKASVNETSSSETGTQ